jgi:hypothetical protein
MSEDKRVTEQRMAFETWKMHSNEVRESVRLMILAEDTTRLKYLQTLFSAFKDG